jgi:lipopolysaccharide biosynthesis glycosyltransferase
MTRSTGNRHAVMLCTDANMMVPALFVAHAVISHAGPAASTFDVVVVTDADAAGEREKQWMAEHGILHNIIDFGFLRTIFDRPGRLTAGALVKLVLPHRFADEYDRILYLDADLTIHSDLSVLFGLDLAGNAIAANRRAVLLRTEAEQQAAETHFTALGMTRPFRYFNSGVMLIDVAAWNTEDLTARPLDFISMNRELCRLPDEDALNAVLNGRFAPLSPAWNMPPRRTAFMDFHEMIEPAITHYSGIDKPWKRFGHDKPLFPDMQAYSLYADFIRATPWPDWLQQQWSYRDIRAGLRSSLRHSWRAWRHRPSEADRERTTNHRKRLAAYLAGGEFADVQQGLSWHDGARLRVRR